MKKISQVKTTTVVAVTKYKITENVCAKITVTNCDPNSTTIQFFLDKKIKKLEGYPDIVFLKDKDAFHKTIKECVTFHNRNEQICLNFNTNVVRSEYDMDASEITDFLMKGEADGFTDDDFAICYSYDHTWRNIQGDRLEQCVHISETDGFKQNDEYRPYDWTLLCNHLENHPRVINFKRIKIPSYNAEFYGQEGLVFDVIIDPIWEGLDAAFREWVHTYDHLGTHKFKKQWVMA